MPSTASLFPSTVVTDATVGTIAWANPGNATANDAVDATASASTSSGTAPPVFSENSIKIFDGTSYTGTNKSTGATLPVARNDRTYGSSADIWGLTIQNRPDLFNASTFGVGVSVTDGTVTNYLKATGFSAGLSPMAIVDGITLTVRCWSDSVNSSFAAGTLIDTPFGPKRIEEVRPGDQILTVNPQTKLIEVGIVKRVRARGGRPLIAIQTICGALLECTPEHPFLTNRGWIRADELTLADTLYRLNGLFLVPTKMRSRSMLLRHDVVHSLYVPGNENYFANGIAVHNVIIGGGGVATAYIDSISMVLTYHLMQPLMLIGVGS